MLPFRDGPHAYAKELLEFRGVSLSLRFVLLFPWQRTAPFLVRLPQSVSISCPLAGVGCPCPAIAFYIFRQE